MTNTELSMLRELQSSQISILKQMPSLKAKIDLLERDLLLANQKIQRLERGSFFTDEDLEVMEAF